ncbi:4Fe-4S double cluster binding domain-containing protein [Caldanaerobius fijiensis DSM 17918]|uniref:4Fe-4S double cluster binding domain-containing protein n=1 Tax=Caldanaerobius fijiensis DSM 17918 TaxID=1121256 RepID=A0A1M4V516_9THEO|nr:4Fe-4S double cluster binding domain-containing protein [Caldanaerobius fijiensis]SHE63973.1 4Fe-4S double cluster binding domain-containing protein [Caldanaerobius fijiensis DSM 17918]
MGGQLDDKKLDLLKSKLAEWGATKYGFGYVGDVLPEKYRHLKYAISIVVRLSDQIIDEIEDGPTYTYFHHYRSVNTLIDNITLRASMLLQEWGYLAMAVPASQTVYGDGIGPYSGIFQHKTAATRSGIGWIGKNCLLVTPEYGPRVRLGTILTDAELPVGQPIEESRCGSCNKCVESCPAGALYGGHWVAGMPRDMLVDPMACSEYMNKHFKHIGRGSVCGICIKVCSYGLHSKV